MMLVAALLLPQLAQGSDSLILAASGKSEYQVVIAADAQEPIPAAAGEFVHFFKEITGITLAIVPDTDPMSAHEIIIGPSKHLDALAICIDWDKLGPGGYVIRTVGNHLLLFGGPARGTINAVYTFLEDHLGCRWYTPTFSVIPREPDLSVDMIHVEKVPAFESRSFEFRRSMPASPEDMAWAARMRLNYFLYASVSYKSIQRARELLSDPRFAKSLIGATRSKEKDGYWTTGRPEWWHTLAAPVGDGHCLLPREHFEKNPEYFGLDAAGKRNTLITPCLTHPAVLAIVVKNAREWLQNTPGANLISVSQPDSSGSISNEFCHCARCRSAWKKFSYKLTGNPLRGPIHDGDFPSWADRSLIRPAYDPTTTRVGPTGVLMEFINRVAEELATDYPGVLVHTFAYYWSYYPPAEMKLHRNVVIDFAPLDECRYHPLADCTHSEQLHGLWTALRRWRKLTPHVWVWRYDYGGKFRPTIRYLDRYMRQLEGARMGGAYFHSISDFYPAAQASSMSDLRRYIYAKLLWAPRWDMRKGIEEFIRAFYGAAAEDMLAYFLDTQEPTSYDGAFYRSDPFHYHDFHSVGTDPVKQEAVRRWDRLLEAAEARVVDAPRHLERVRVERLALQLCALERLPEDDPVRVRAYRDFFANAERAGYDAQALDKLRAKFGPKN